MLNEYATNSKSLKTSLGEDVYKQILDNSYDEIFVLDRDGYVIYVNNVCERHYALKADDVLGRHIDELNDLDYWSPNIMPIVRREKRRITREQTTFLGRKLLTTATPVLNEKGEIIFTVYNTRDTTQLEAIKQELEVTRQALTASKGKNDSSENRCDIITHNIKMKQLINFAEQVAGVDSNVLILGDTGTGKGLFARHIHRNSLRKDGPFITINCAAIPEDLLESELFGYSHGAFTGANKSGKKGLIELADKGVLFFDEIGELSLRLQAKILHFIQERQYIPVGGTEMKTADVRVLSATNRDLLEMIGKGEFREDLFYRLNVIEINIPPLKERPEDVRALTSYFLGKFNAKYNVCRDISKECMDILCQYSWPGNVRELENFIERLVVIVREYEIKPCHLTLMQREKFKKNPNIPNTLNAPDISSFPSDMSFDRVIEKVEKELITNAVERFGSSRKVAKALKISHSKAARLIRKYC